MKKLIAVLLALAMIFSMAACTTPAPASNDGAKEEQQDAGAEEAAEPAEAGEKVLKIAYHATLTSLNPFQGMSEAMGPLGLYGYQTLFYKS